MKTIKLFLLLAGLAAVMSVSAAQPLSASARAEADASLAATNTPDAKQSTPPPTATTDSTSAPSDTCG